MCSILMLGRTVCTPAWSTFYGWNLVVTGVRKDCSRHTVIANQVCNDSSRNKQVPVVLTWHFFQRNAIQFSKDHSVLESTCLVEDDLLQMICILTKACSFAPWKI